MNLYLVEYYNLAGSIWMAWVGAKDRESAEEKLKTKRVDSRGLPIRFAERIQITEQACIADLGPLSVSPRFVDVPRDKVKHCGADWQPAEIRLGCL